VLAPDLSHSGWIHSVRFTPDGKHLVSGGAAPLRKGSLAVWQAADGRLVRGLELPTGAIHSLDIDPSGKLVALGCGPAARGDDSSLAYLLTLPLNPDAQAAARAAR
jgi:WD40 repeat protein